MLLDSGAVEKPMLGRYQVEKELAEYGKDGQLLPTPIVLWIVARVAEALAWSHQQHLAHRDIKPVSIMHEMESDTVKVTGFDISRMTDSSKTKTGLGLGHPKRLPAALAHLVAVSRGKRPEARYQDGAQFAHALRAVLSALPAEVAPLGAAVATPMRQGPSVEAKTPQFEKTVALTSPTKTLNPRSSSTDSLDN